MTETRIDEAESSQGPGASIAQPIPAEVELISLAGRLDVVSSNTLRQTIKEHIDGGRNRLLIDLSVIDFVDSAGLAALVRGMKLARQAGGDVRLVRPRRSDAMRVFELTTFDKIFEMGETAQEMASQWSAS